MKVVVQRVKSSSVKVDSKIVGSIDKGLLVLVGFTHDDNIDKIKWMVNKIVNLRIFDDEEGVMNKSVLDIGGSILSVSQFTLYADANKGNRPSYINAMKQEDASSYYDIFNEELKSRINTQTGIFRADMQVELINDGPITIIIEK
jgi:D-tyrosyl-tRNA(Tyr) deacylase